MRKRWFTVWAVGATLLAGMPARAQEPPDTAEIRALELKMLDYYKHHQVDVFAAVLDDDFVITFEDGSTYSKTGYLSFSASSSTKVEVAEIIDMKIRRHGDTVIVTGMYHEKGVDHQRVYDYHDRFTDVWMRESGKWRLVAAHYAVPTK